MISFSFMGELPLKSVLYNNIHVYAGDHGSWSLCWMNIHLGIVVTSWSTEGSEHSCLLLSVPIKARVAVEASVTKKLSWSWSFEKQKPVSVLSWIQSCHPYHLKCALHWNKVAFVFVEQHFWIGLLAVGLKSSKDILPVPLGSICEQCWHHSFWGCCCQVWWLFGSKEETVWTEAECSFPTSCSDQMNNYSYLFIFRKGLEKGSVELDTIIAYNLLKRTERHISWSTTLPGNV